MLTLTNNKYEFEGVTSNNLYVFRRIGKREWIIVEQARYVILETREVKHMRLLGETTQH